MAVPGWGLVWELALEQELASVGLVVAALVLAGLAEMEVGVEHNYPGAVLR